MRIESAWPFFLLLEDLASSRRTLVCSFERRLAQVSRIRLFGVRRCPAVLRGSHALQGERVFAEGSGENDGACQAQGRWRREARGIDVNPLMAGERIGIEPGAVC